MLNNKTNKNLNSEWSMISYGALCLVYCQAALFSALPTPWASVPVTGKNRGKNLGLLFQDIIRLSLHCQRGAVSSKAKDLKKQIPVNLSVYGKFWERCFIWCWEVPLGASHSCIFHSHRIERAVPLSAFIGDGETAMQNHD